MGLGLVLLGGCSPAPPEVIGVSQGQSGSAESSSSGASGDSVVSDSTGPVADGSASSATGAPEVTSNDGTTSPVEPATTTGDPPLETTGPGATTDEPGSSSDGEVPPVTCAEIFGGASGYVLCMETEGSCSFNVNTGGNSCTTICSSFGQGCVDTLDNPSAVGQECVIQPTDLDCGSTGKSTTICVCTK